MTFMSAMTASTTGGKGCVKSGNNMKVARYMPMLNHIETHPTLHTKFHNGRRIWLDGSIRRHILLLILLKSSCREKDSDVRNIW